MMREQVSSAKDKFRFGLCLGALGVVFGDIGTSPLYTMKECLMALPVGGQEAGVYGVLSLVFWALILVVCGKYIWFILRADNKGEGGIFSLLAVSGVRERPLQRGGLMGITLIALMAASLLFGESVITPAITVLSAAEGLKGFDMGLEQTHVIWIAVGILMALFWVQKRGTESIGKVFGPVMLFWFVLLGGIGIWHIVQNPSVLWALNPWYGYDLLFSGRLPAGGITMLLGSVVLAITGVEALYADMGHFGRKAIARAWYWFVLPGLVLSYFGQGAHALSSHSVENPFFSMLPEGWPQGTLSILSIGAAIIASQAVISGAYSISLSAIQLGYFPRLKVAHTSALMHGQIYVPIVNFMLAVTSIAIVLTFKTSESLAAAYGVAVTGTMVITTFFFYFALINKWKWPTWKALTLCGAFWVFDWSLFISTLHKFMDGGWLPVFLGIFIFLLMHTWKSGRVAVRDVVMSSQLVTMSPADIVNSEHLTRVKGCAVFMAASPHGIPIVMAHHLKANKCLQEVAIILTIAVDEEVPYVEDSVRMSIEDLGGGLWRVLANYGYMEQPSVTKVLEDIVERGVPLKFHATTFYFNREVIVAEGKSKLFNWQVNLYSFLTRNARPVKDYYRILPTQIIEVGLPITL